MAKKGKSSPTAPVEVPSVVEHPLVPAWSESLSERVCASLMGIYDVKRVESWPPQGNGFPRIRLAIGTMRPPLSIQQDAATILRVYGFPFTPNDVEIRIYKEQRTIYPRKALVRDEQGRDLWLIAGSLYAIDNGQPQLVGLGA